MISILEPFMISVGKDAQVTQAFELNVVQTAAEIEAADSDGAP